jgi:hypothetical protein
VNIILDAKSRIYKKSIHKIEEKSNETEFGFAIKLSTLNNHQISISKVLEETERTIIIDAEYKRLDQWLQHKVETGVIQNKHLDRILITVQAKRFDAESQLTNLERMRINVVLVSGHGKYLSKKERQRSAVKLLAEYYQKYANISYLGISAKMHEKLSNELDYRINDSVVLELYGDHKLMKSGLWAYFGRKELSDEAKEYVLRRKLSMDSSSFFKTLSQYIIQSETQLRYYNKQRSVFIYLDILSEAKFIELMKEFNS